jgi:hypothetical protein
VLKCANDSVATVWTTAQTSRGDRSRIIQSTDGKVEKVVTLTDGTMMRAFENANVKSTIQISPQAALAEQLDPKAECLKTFGGGQMIDAVKESDEDQHGVNTVKIITTTGRIRTTAWHAPAFGCTPLRRLYEEQSEEGEWKLISVLETTNISLSEPDPGLFVSSAREVPPSVAAETLARVSLRESKRSAEEIERKVEASRRMGAAKDANYYAHRETLAR